MILSSALAGAAGLRSGDSSTRLAVKVQSLAALARKAGSGTTTKVDDLEHPELQV